MVDQPVDAPEIETLRLLQYGTESDLLEAAITHIQSVLPDWEPQQGNTEVVLLQGLALMLGPEIMAIQMLGDRVIEGVMSLYGVTRSQGVAATGRVAFKVTNSNPTQVIPLGSRLRLVVSSTGETVDLLTTEELRIITSETLTGEVNVVAEIEGDTSNGMPAGTFVSTVTSLPFVESAVLALPMSGGAGEESDGSFSARAASTLARQVSTLVGTEQFEYAALTRSEVGRAKAFDNYNPAVPGSPQFGHVTVAVASQTGTALTSPVMTDIEYWLEAQALASLVVHVIAPTYTTVNLNVTVKADVGQSAAAVKANVEAALRAWLSPITWPWESTVEQFSMISVVGNAGGVKQVQSVPATIALAGKAPLPTIGTINVTVN
ncbi:baseplate J protein [Arthrobacter phage Zartrosa]|uniref:Baseplate J protein n=3 Tax=Marthavirus TaxID=1980936 RepID=A0A0U4JUD0_9CAUD|nr:baseplate J-like protein [Arthrobacter phage Sonny]YP_009612484.1 baseplate J-like protein [Arthrobacter phage Shade]YP_009884252.1 baseplate J-like protein [Arthrobacter phage Zartrosa]ASR80584.1 baseplate J protein [Arthrobacter phage Jordan]ALY10299.1 baseplate J protein [Arthrobacter phage Sonny]ASR80736.1 baseplate J protein [Arthrobacter phage Shade]QED11143.1 baseplate J protein [Arthrobacter phage Zartrosa]